MESNNNTYVPLFSKKDCKYTSCYCEENTFLLCKKFVESLPNEVKLNDQIYLSQGYCVFATNSEKQTEIRFQKAGNQDLYKTVTWDYHVFFIHQLQNKEKKEDIISKVYDLDTVLAFPEDFENYFDKSFNFEKKHGKKQIEVLIKDIFFRVIEANLFVENFASDRSHMVTGVKKEGKKFVKAYSAPPPDYPNIINKNKETMNLEKYWDIKNTDPKFGKFLNQSQFSEFFAVKRT